MAAHVSPFARARAVGPMLGTPNRPPRLADLASRWAAFRWAARDCGRFLASPFTIPAIPAPRVPYTLIAGTAGPCGRLSPFGTEPNDGIVAVAETRIRADDEPRLLPVWHSFLMDDTRVRAAVAAAMMTASPPNPT